jgi:hypothetical protein
MIPKQTGSSVGLIACINKQQYIPKSGTSVPDYPRCICLSITRKPSSNLGDTTFKMVQLLLGKAGIKAANPSSPESQCCAKLAKSRGKEAPCPFSFLKKEQRLAGCFYACVDQARHDNTAWPGGYIPCLASPCLVLPIHYTGDYGVRYCAYEQRDNNGGNAPFYCERVSVR